MTDNASRARLLAVPLALSIVLLLAVAGCGGSGTKTTKLTVFAAASLQEPFTALGKQFEKDHPGTSVVFSFGASDVLAQQTTQGAPADVLATASQTTMDQATGAEDVQLFASNSMEIAVPPKNPAQITSLQDLARKGVKVALCQATVPCGVVAAKVFANAKLSVTPVTEEADVKSVLTKVSLGEVDAGVVYVSDVHTAGSSVTGVPISQAFNAVTSYPISVIGTTKHQALAKSFEQFALGAQGQQAMAAAGFAKP